MSFINLPVLCHGRTISDEFLFPVEEYKAREAKVKEILEDKNLDGLLIYADGFSRGNSCYLTNYHVFLSWGSAILVFPKEGKPMLVATIPSRDVVFTKKSMPEFVEILPIGLSQIRNDHLTIGTVKYLEDNNLLKGHWGGVNLGDLPSIAYAPLIEKVPDIVDCTDDYGALRAIKNKNEQYAITQAATMSARAVNEYLRLAEEGISEIELSSQIERLCKINGVDNASFLVSSGNEDTRLKQPSERKFQKGDIVSVFVNIQYQRYNGAFGATKVIGGPSPDQAELLELAQKCWDKKLAEINQSKKAAIGQTNSICKDGNVSYTLINGIGIDLVETPSKQGTECELKPGMTLNMSLNVEKSGIGSVLISHTLLIGKDFIRLLDGCEI